MSVRNDTPYLFDVGQQVANEQIPERRFASSGLLLGTSAFTADGWQGTFYPVGMRRADYLKFYGTIVSFKRLKWIARSMAYRPRQE